MKKTALLIAFAAITFSIGSPSLAHAQKWADLTMTVLLDGEIPEPKEVIVNNADCMQFKIVSENLVVDPATKGIANVVFWIDSKKTKLTTKQLHPDAQKVPEGKPEMDNQKCAFVPHVMSMRAGQTLLMKNSDSSSHNAKVSFIRNEEVNPLVPAGGSKDIVTTVEEPSPTPVQCSIHPWMKGFVIVATHPYVGISDAVGSIKIKNLPAGVELDFKLWHEFSNKSIEEVTLNGKKENWTKGSVNLTLKEGANDLGILLIKPDRFRSE